MGLGVAAFVTSGPSRKTDIKRMMRAFGAPPRSLAFLLQDIEDPVNVGAIFRIADACRVDQVVLSGITATPPHKLIDKVGRGKDKKIRWKHQPDPVAAALSLRDEGYAIHAVEITEDAAPYSDVDFPAKTCLVVGHEDHGVTKKLLAVCDAKVFIPMYGKGASLNVHVALAVVAFGALQRR